MSRFSRHRALQRVIRQRHDPDRAKPRGLREISGRVRVINTDEGRCFAGDNSRDRDESRDEKRQCDKIIRRVAPGRAQHKARLLTRCLYGGHNWHNDRIPFQNVAEEPSQRVPDIFAKSRRMRIEFDLFDYQTFGVFEQIA